MSTTHHMKMAKASQADIDAAIQLHQFLRAMSQGRSAPEVVDEFGYTGYGDLLDRQAADVEFALRAYENGDLFRVVWGMQTLLDPRNEVVDPSLPHLELHPKHDQAARELDAARAENERLAKQRDEKRERLRKVVEMVAEASDLMDGDKSDREHAEHLLADAISYGMSTSPKAIAAEQPKPLTWPHLPEVDRPDSEVQP